MIISLVVIMVVSLAVIPFASPWVERMVDDWRRDHPTNEPTPVAPPLDPGGPEEGSSGAGDPYFPNYGSSGFDVEKYVINLDWSPDRDTLTGSTTVHARAAHTLKSFYLDLVLPVTRVTVNGAPADFSREGFYDVAITPAAEIDEGERFTATVEYSGDPADFNTADVKPWWTAEEEVIATGEPEAAAWWYAANDHPSDPATFDISVRVPAGWEAISNGRLISADIAHEDDFDTWRWALDTPMSTYQAFVAIGQYELRQGVAGGRAYAYAVSEQLSEEARRKAFQALEKTPTIVADLEEFAGPYPYREIGGIVPAHDFWFAGLESATRPIYEAGALTGGDPSELLIHELAHMWYGGRVNLEQWNDIFTNEAYASYAAWLIMERDGGTSAEQQLHDHYRRLQGQPRFWRVTMNNPGSEHLFDAVYLRGPMTLQALRNVIGDDAFFQLSRDWAGQSGPYSLEDWMDAAQDATTVDLDPFFQAWIYAETAPARTAQNGLA